MSKRATEKLYYDDVTRLVARAKVVEIDRDKVVLDATSFYPEGGGQVGDIGRLGPFRVTDTQKRGGRTVSERGLPVVNVETEVVHHLDGDATGVLAPGNEVDLAVDPHHREGCMRHHGATHLVMCKIWEKLGRDSFVTKGCLIGPDEARLDLATGVRFDAALIEEIRRGVDEWVGVDAAVTMQPVPHVPEMFIWECGLNEFTRMPCGGTHFDHLGPIGGVQIQRRSKGKGLERLYIRVGGRREG